MLKGNYNIKLSLCGDLMVSRRLPEKDTKEITELKRLLSEHDCRFGNLETTVLNKNEGYPELFPGGGYAMASPRCLKELKTLGFNLLNAATNHAMDYSHNGLLKTIENLKEADIPFAGIGSNLAEASAPVYCECSEGRVALVGVTSSFHDSYAAGPQCKDMIGRPGVAPLRHKAVYHICDEDYNCLVKIAKVTGINSYHEMGIRAGYLLPSSNFKFGSFEFKKDKEFWLETTPNESDLQRTLSSIREARIQSDVVILSIHSHQFKDNDETKTPDFVSIFAKRCIDEGADIVVCHGSHRLRGIEIYNGKPIFHGLGNFVFHHEQQENLPEDFYNKYGTTRQDSDGPGDIFKIRSKNGKIGLLVEPNVWDSILVSVHIVNGQVKIKLYPCEISKVTGLPAFTKNLNVLSKLQELSSLYKTSIEINEEECIGVISL